MIPTPTPTPSTGCSVDRNAMVNKDIPMDGGWINIKCSTCITIHKVRAACGTGDPVQSHMKTVS